MWSTLVALALASTALAGCLGGDEGGTGGTPTTPTGGSPTPTTPTQDDGRQSSTELYGITSGSTGGTYYPIANGIAAAARNSTTVQFEFEVASSGGSTVNAQRLKTGEHEWALMQNDVAYYAVQGLPPFDSPIPEITAVSALYPEMIQVVVLKDSGINTLQDLAGKQVVLGAPGSGAAVNAGQILNASGVQAQTQYLDLNAAAEQLKDGNVDAVFWTGGIPTGAIVSLATTHPIRVLEIDGQTKQRLKQEYPFYGDATLPAGTYNGVDQDVNTVAIVAVLVVRSDVPEDDVYLLTQMLFEGGDVQKAHAQARNIKLESAFNGLDRVPFHPGAVAYYEEQNLTPPTGS